MTVCCGFPSGTENDRNGLSMLSNELSPAQSPDSKVRTQFLIGQLLNRSLQLTHWVSSQPLLLPSFCDFFFLIDYDINNLKHTVYEYFIGSHVK